jgi:hypothetical protein
MQYSTKKLRGVTMADNWKKQEIKNIINLRDEMIENNIDNNLIDKYVNEEYEKINREYNEKIIKVQKKENLNKKHIDKKMINKKKQAIKNLLKDKDILEQRGANPEYIKNYLEKQYTEINKNYEKNKDTIYNIDLEKINFID